MSLTHHTQITHTQHTQHTQNTHTHNTHRLLVAIWLKRGRTLHQPRRWPGGSCGEGPGARAPKIAGGREGAGCSSLPWKKGKGRLRHGQMLCENLSKTAASTSRSKRGGAAPFWRGPSPGCVGTAPTASEKGERTRRHCQINDILSQVRGHRSRHRRPKL